MLQEKNPKTEGAVMQGRLKGLDHYLNRKNNLFQWTEELCEGALPRAGLQQQPHTFPLRVEMRVYFGRGLCSTSQMETFSWG